MSALYGAERSPRLSTRSSSESSQREDGSRQLGAEESWEAAARPKGLARKRSTTTTEMRHAVPRYAKGCHLLMHKVLDLRISLVHPAAESMVGILA